MTYLDLTLITAFVCITDAYLQNDIFSMITANTLIPKQWHKYIEKYLFSSLQHLNTTGNIAEWHKKHKKLIQLFANISESQISIQFQATFVKRATGLFKLHINRDLKKLFGYKNQANYLYDNDASCNFVCYGYHWIFQVHEKLTLNFTIQEIFFSSGPHLCQEGVLQLSYISQKFQKNQNSSLLNSEIEEPCRNDIEELRQGYKESDFYFCGHHSSFTIFPEENCLALSLLLHHETYFVIDFIFSVMDKNIVTTKQVNGSRLLYQPHQ